MSQRAKHSARTAVVALAAAGIGAAAVVGAGASAAVAEPRVAPLTVSTSAAVAAQAETLAKGAAQAKAAQAKAVAAKKAAAAKAAAAKKAAAKKAAAKKAVDWVKPVTGYKLTASFNQGGSMWTNKHSGQDFAVPVGTPVKAVHGGTVVKAGPNGGGDGPAYGNAVVIKHGNGTYSQYAHLSKIDVKVGSKVKTGQLIARSGNTGNSSGPHLHFEIRTTPNYGSSVNPASFLRSEGVSI
ncbi:peptidase [Streptomyces sp. CC53]|uniref:M23 family metallopeptidase n=1 Tax=unclassified Streptomyces TaxID=2593676 RepID=UPI0008DC8C92|nr:MULTISPECIES: M23 family metallopeptidase [unclassified Streptomyces]OII64061.1 peptidase [Streptomyces sp. CC53]OII68235.1 peptidase [Streptomyces sp. CC77]